MTKVGPLGSLMKALHAPVYARRLETLVDAILPHLRPGDEVLDVGCGVGTLGAAILSHPSCPEGVRVRGLERVVRGGEPIEVIPYDGGQFPFPDGAVDVVILADVLHHDTEPRRLLDECRRVTRRALVLKDHLRAGPLAQQRISLIDWAANAPHGVPCLYRYYSPDEWKTETDRLALRIAEQRLGMRLYPPLFEQFFGGRLQYFAVLEHPPAPEPDPAARVHAEQAA